VEKGKCDSEETEEFVVIMLNTLPGITLRTNQGGYQFRERWNGLSWQPRHISVQLPLGGW